MHSSSPRVGGEPAAAQRPGEIWVLNPHCPASRFFQACNFPLSPFNLHCRWALLKDLFSSVRPRLRLQSKCGPRGGSLAPAEWPCQELVV